MLQLFFDYLSLPKLAVKCCNWNVSFWSRQKKVACQIYRTLTFSQKRYQMLKMGLLSNRAHTVISFNEGRRTLMNMTTTKTGLTGVAIKTFGQRRFGNIGKIQPTTMMNTSNSSLRCGIVITSSMMGRQTMDVKQLTKWWQQSTMQIHTVSPRSEIRTERYFHQKLIPEFLRTPPETPRKSLHTFPPPPPPPTSGDQSEVEALAHKDMAVRWGDSSMIFIAIVAISSYWNLSSSSSLITCKHQAFQAPDKKEMTTPCIVYQSRSFGGTLIWPLQSESSLLSSKPPATNPTNQNL